MVYKKTYGQQGSVFAKRMETILSNLNTDILVGYCSCQNTHVPISSFSPIRVDKGCTTCMYYIHSLYYLDTDIPDLYLDFELFWLDFKLLYTFNVVLNHCASTKRLKKILQVLTSLSLETQNHDVRMDFNHKWSHCTTFLEKNPTILRCKKHLYSQINY